MVIHFLSHICGIEDPQSSHIVQATLEAVCFEVHDILEANYGSSLSQLKVDGGMTANSLLMQLQADLAGVSIAKPEMAESTALGAAMVAVAAVGHWDIAGSNMQIPLKVWNARPTEDQRDVKYSGWKMAVECAMGWDI